MVVAPREPKVVELADLTPGVLAVARGDVAQIVAHARRLVARAGVVDARAYAQIEAVGHGAAVGDARDAHRRGEVLRVARLAIAVADAVEGAGEVDEGSRVAQPLAVVVEDVVAREAQQHEFLGREVAVDGDVRRSRDRVGAVESVEARQQEADAEAHVRRVVGAGGDAPVDLLFEGAVFVRVAVVVDDAPEQPRALGGESRRVGGGAQRIGGRGRLGADLAADGGDRIARRNHLRVVVCQARLLRGGRGGRQQDPEADEDTSYHGRKGSNNFRQIKTVLAFSGF